MHKVMIYYIMSDISYIDKAAMTDDVLVAIVGKFIKHHRILQQKTQSAVAEAADISRSTLSLLERGENVSLSTLIQVLRVLDLLYILDVFDVHDEISPIAYAKMKKYTQRQRVSVAKEPTPPYKTNLGW